MSLVEVPISVRAAVLRGTVPEGLVLRDREFVVSYLSLFSPEKREPKWGYHKENPTLADLLKSMGGMSAAREVDECVDVRVVGNRFYLTEQRTYGDDYNPFGFYKFVLDNEFDLARYKHGSVCVDVGDKLPAGYCYLRAFHETRQFCAAYAFGPSPVMGRVLPHLPDRLDLEYDLRYAHVPVQTGTRRVTLADVPPQLPVGGDFCSNVLDQPAPDLPLCHSCQVVDRVKIEPLPLPTPCSHGAQVRSENSLGWASEIRAPRPDDLPAVFLPGRDVWSTLGPGPLRSNGVYKDVCVGHDVLGAERVECSVNTVLQVHKCLEKPLVATPYGYWGLYVPPGHAVYNGWFRFEPGDKSRGGYVYGCDSVLLGVAGVATQLPLALMTEQAYERVTHTRYKLGSAGRIGKLASVFSSDLVLHLPPLASQVGHEVEPGGSRVREGEELWFPVGLWGTCVSSTRARTEFSGGLLTVVNGKGTSKGSSIRIQVIGTAAVFSCIVTRSGRALARTRIVVPDDEERLDYADSDCEHDVGSFVLPTYRKYVVGAAKRRLVPASGAG